VSQLAADDEPVVCLAPLQQRTRQTCRVTKRRLPGLRSTLTMWLERQLARIRGSDVIVIRARPSYGVHRLIAALAEESTLVWLVLEAADVGDSLAQGNKLSDALRVATGSRLFPRATPVRAGIALLKRYLDALAPITVAASGIGGDLDLARALLMLSGNRCSVILSDDRLSNDFIQVVETAAGREITLLDETSMAVTFAEALLLAGDRLSPAELKGLLEETGWPSRSCLPGFTMHSATGRWTNSWRGTPGLPPGRNSARPITLTPCWLQGSGGMWPSSPSTGT
jgi:hypothetical protein